LKHREGEPRKTVWHRQVRVVRMSTNTWPGCRVLISGPDAPLDERGAKIWHLTVGVVLVLGAVVVVLSFLSR
jgi:hypothetical protein